MGKNSNPARMNQYQTQLLPWTKPNQNLCLHIVNQTWTEFFKTTHNWKFRFSPCLLTRQQKHFCRADMAPKCRKVQWSTKMKITALQIGSIVNQQLHYLIIVWNTASDSQLTDITLLNWQQMSAQLRSLSRLREGRNRCKNNPLLSQNKSLNDEWQNQQLKSKRNLIKRQMNCCDFTILIERNHITLIRVNKLLSLFFTK